MQGFNEEVFKAERLRSGVTIPVKIAEINLKAGESVNLMQPIYYNSTGKEFTTKSENGELYGFSASIVEANSDESSTTKMPIYLTGEFYKESVILTNDEDKENLIIQARKIGIFLE